MSVPDVNGYLESTEAKFKELEAQIKAIEPSVNYSAKINFIAKENIAQTEQIQKLKEEVKDLKSIHSLNILEKDKEIDELCKENEKLIQEIAKLQCQLRSVKHDTQSQIDILTVENLQLRHKNANLEGLNILNASLLKNNYELKAELARCKEEVEKMVTSVKSYLFGKTT